VLEWSDSPATFVGKVRRETDIKGVIFRLIVSDLPRIDDAARFDAFRGRRRNLLLTLGSLKRKGSRGGSPELRKTRWPGVDVGEDEAVEQILESLAP
jgi:hypothetical protein